MKFIVKGLPIAGNVVRLTVEATDTAEVHRVVAGQGISVLAVKPLNPLAGWLPQRQPRFALELFGQELVSLLESGLSLVEAVETLAEKDDSSDTPGPLNKLLEHLYRGQRFSDALEQYPAFFPTLFVASMRAAERTGDIGEAISRYLTYHAQIDRIRRKLVSALVYPVLLIAVGTLVTGFLLLYVVPKFSSIYEEIGSQLPFLTRALVQWGRLMEAHALAAMLGAVLLAGAATFAVTRPALRRFIGPRLWRLPAIGYRMRIYQYARFYRTFSMLLKSGIPLPAALDMASGLLSPYLRDGMERAARDIRDGQPVSRSFQKQGLTTRIALRLLVVGERSGRLPYMVERIALFYEDELARWVDWFMQLFEPLLMILIGAIIGLIVVLLYLPIFELAGSVK